MRNGDTRFGFSGLSSSPHTLDLRVKSSRCACMSCSTSRQKLNFGKKWSYEVCPRHRRYACPRAMNLILPCPGIQVLSRSLCSKCNRSSFNVALEMDLPLYLRADDHENEAVRQYKCEYRVQGRKEDSKNTKFPDKAIQRGAWNGPPALFASRWSWEWSGETIQMWISTTGKEDSKNTKFPDKVIQRGAWNGPPTLLTSRWSWEWSGETIQMWRKTVKIRRVSIKPFRVVLEINLFLSRTGPTGHDRIGFTSWHASDSDAMCINT